jgi:hypothetical protein
VTLYHACQPFITVDDIECACDLPAWVTQQDLIDAATDAITILSGGLISGRCQITVRPRNENAWCGTNTYLGEAIRLPGFMPEVTAVRVDGVLLVEDVDYKLVNGNELYRIDNYWPGSQYALRADTEEGTFSITYEFGMVPPLYAKIAVVELVCESAKKLSTGNSRLPDKAIQATMDGVTIELDPRAGDLGLEAVGQVMAIFAPDGPGGTAVWTPELMSGWTLLQVS